MSDIYKRFEEHLKPGSRILDLGCGSGRDSKYFLDKGNDVVSLDASETMCKKTYELTGRPALNMRIEDINCEMNLMRCGHVPRCSMLTSVI